MTCREFKRAAASQTAMELAQSSDERISSHTKVCADCGAWLEEQRMLAAGMQALRARTAAREAGPLVEQALLRTFRQQSLGHAPLIATSRVVPGGFRLSRFFELGAYVAVAAAIVVGLFLGVRLLQRRSPGITGQTSPAVTVPVQQAQASSSASDQQHVGPAMRVRPVMPVKREVTARALSHAVSTRHSSAATSPVAEDPDYVALMFCDPLICSSDAQVVRLELPVVGASDAQTQVADVVVGDDGLVRAIRMVN